MEHWKLGSFDDILDDAERAIEEASRLDEDHEEFEVQVGIAVCILVQANYILMSKLLKNHPTLGKQEFWSRAVDLTRKLFILIDSLPAEDPTHETDDEAN